MRHNPVETENHFSEASLSITLTPKQRAYVEGIENGKTLREIAEVKGIVLGTAKTGMSKLKDFVGRIGERPNDRISLLLKLGQINPQEIEDFKKSLEKSSLSAREIEVVGLAMRGFFNKEIARELGISLYTVKNHLNRSYKKLGIPRRAGRKELIRRLLNPIENPPQ